MATNQLLYNLTRRGIEWDLLPWLRERRVPVMAYSPLEQARLTDHPKLAAFSKRHGMTPAQAALAWLLAKDDVIVIPKCGRRERLTENLGALEHPLSAGAARRTRPPVPAAIRPEPARDALGRRVPQPRFPEPAVSPPL